MVDIVTRLGKGSPLTNAEVDANFTNLAEVSGVTGEPMGHEDRTTSTISFNASTRTFTIAPTASSFTVWCKGKKVVVSSAQTIVIPNTTGMHSIYYDANGTLSSKIGYFTFSTEAPTAYVYWNATTGAAPYFGDERHGVVLDWQTHEYLHRTRGAVIANGFLASGYTLNSSATNAATQIAIESGTFFDEDMKIDIVSTATPTAGTYQQNLLFPAKIPVLHLQGTSWVMDAPTDFPFKQGTSRPQYNSLSGGVWSTTDVGNNQHATTWILATNNLTYPVIAIIGQSATDNQGEAEAFSFADLTLTGFPSVEFRPLYKLVYKASDSYVNSVNTELVSIVDLRSISAVGAAANPATDHGNLSGLSDDDHPQYLSVDTVRGSLTAAVKASFLPLQTSNAGKFLQTDGTATSWQALTSGNVTTALGFTPYNATNPSGFITGITSGNVTTALGFTPYNATNPSGYVTAAGARGSISVTGAGSYDSATGVINIVGGVTSFNTRTGAITLSSSDVTTALGFTPYNSTNPNGYLTGITSTQVTTALGYTPYNSSNPSGYITGITSGMVTTALGFTPYNNSNPSGYITSAALSPYLTTASAASTYLPLAGGTLTGTVYGRGLVLNAFAAGTSGGGLELGWDGTQTVVQGYNRTTAAFLPLWLETSSLRVGINGLSKLSFDGSAANFGVAIQQSGNQVLHAGNYDSYALPYIVSSTRTLRFDTAVNGEHITFQNQTSGGAIQLGFQQNDTDGLHHRAYFKFYKGSAGSIAGAMDIIMRSVGGSTTSDIFRLQAGSAPTWAGSTMLTAANYNSYSPTLTGTNASGTWNISITGSAGSAGSVDYNNLTNKAGGTGTYTTSGDYRAPIFYDSSDTNYYVDLNSNSKLYYLQILGSGVFDGSTSLNVTNNAYIYGRAQIIITGRIDNSNDGWALTSPRNGILFNVNSGGAQGAIGTTNFNLQYNLLTAQLGVMTAYSAVSPSIYWAASDPHTRLNGNLIAPIFYDSNDTSYYVDPASSSLVNNMYANGQLSGGYSVGRPASLNGSNWAARIGANDVYLVMNSLNETASYASAIQSMRTSDAASFPLLLNPNGGNVTVAQNSSMGFPLGVNGIIYSNTDVRAPIFYDSNDTNYYVNPNSSSNLLSLNVAGTGVSLALTGANSRISFKDSENVWTGYVGFSGTTGQLSFPGRNATINTGYNATLTLETGVSGYNSGQVVIPWGKLEVQNGDIRSPVYYDYNDTAYYGDFSATSVFSKLWLNGKQGINGGVPPTSGTSTPAIQRIHAGYPTYGEVLDIGMTIGPTYAWIQATNYSNLAVNYALYLNPNGGFVSAGSDFRAPIFYDSNDTSRYVNPNGKSYLASLNINGASWISFNDEEGSWGIKTRNTDSTTWLGANLKNQIFCGGGASEGLSVTGIGTGGASMEVNNAGNMWVKADVRAPIYYDRDNTGHYVDPASTSQFNVAVGNRFSAPNSGLISVGDDSASYTYNDGSTRSRVYISSAYPVLTLNSSITTSNTNHGPTLQFTFNGHDSNRQWVIGSGGTGTFLDFGTGQSSIRNPHDGIAGYGGSGSGKTLMRMTSDGIGIGGNWGAYGTVENPSYPLHVQGVGFASGSFRAPIFYDSQDTTYYVDPNSTGVALRIAGAIRGDHVNWTGEHNKIQWHGSSMYFQNMNNGYWIFRKSDGNEPFVFHADGYGIASGSWRAPIFYDSNDTGYYVDPSTTSTSVNVAGVVNAAGAVRGSYYVASNYGATGYTQYKGYDNNNHFIVIRGGVGGTTTTPSITGQHQTTFVEYAEANDGSGWFFKTSETGNYDIISRITRSYSHFNSSVRSPLFYDSDDTAYYVNPNSGSLLSTLTVNNYLNVTTGRAANEYGHAANFVSTQSAATNYTPFNFASTYGNHSWGIVARFRIETGGQDRPSIQFSTAGTDNRWNVGYCYFDDNFRITQNMGMRNDGTSDGWGTERFLIDTSGNVQLNVSARSPIYYDLNNTAYYVDPASNSVLNSINGRGISNLMYYQGFTLDANTMDTNATGFTYAVNAPTVGPVTRFSTGGGYDLWLNAAYSGGNTLFFRTRNGDAGSINAWRPLVSYGVNYGDSLYATILYDANDTGFYCDPTGTSRFTALNVVNNITVSSGNTTGNGIILADDGDIVDLNDGYCAMRFSYGVRVHSANRGGGAVHTLHSNGTFTASGNVTAYSDERLKSDWAPVATDFVERLAKVKSGTYTRIDNSKRQAGSSAQDWQQLLPEVVTEADDEAKTLSLAYGNAALVSAVELAKEVVDLRNRVAQLESLINKLIGD